MNPISSCTRTLARMQRLLKSDHATMGLVGAPVTNPISKKNNIHRQHLSDDELRHLNPATVSSTCVIHILL